MATRIPYKKIEEIPGWFRRMDMELFRLLLDSTEEHLGGGDIAELTQNIGYINHRHVHRHHSGNRYLAPTNEC